VAIDRVECASGVVRVAAHARAIEVPCQTCGTVSSRVHSRYLRRLGDLAVGGQPVAIQLTVRRFFCANASCARQTFAEQIPGLTLRHGRRSAPLHDLLASIGLALAGRAGARLAGRLGVTVHPTTLLRLVRALPEPQASHATGPAVLGVDDFALRRGHVYGTVLVDIDGHRPIDLLPDRTAETLATWLGAHPGVQIVCRDRSGAYADGARTGAPHAIQVADRWHLWHNLGEAVEKTVIRHRADLPEPEPNTADDPPAGPPVPPVTAVTAVTAEAADTDARPAEGRLAVRTRERHAAVHALLTRGVSRSGITRQLRLDPHTVRRYARAARVEDLLTTAQARASLLDPFKAYLHQRFNSGCTDAARLTTEITAQGYRGSDQTVRRYLQPYRATLVAPPPTPVRPSVRQVTGWLTRHPEGLTEDETLQLKKLLHRSPALATTYQHVHDFADIMANRKGRQLASWMRQVDADGSPELRSLVTGLRGDLDAVTNGLTLPYSSGPVEGHVNRIKMLKRQMYGRASFDLLRKRVLLA